MTIFDMLFGGLGSGQHRIVECFDCHAVEEGEVVGVPAERVDETPVRCPQCGSENTETYDPATPVIDHSAFED